MELPGCSPTVASRPHFPSFTLHSPLASRFPFPGNARPVLQSPMKPPARVFSRRWGRTWAAPRPPGEVPLAGDPTPDRFLAAATLAGASSSPSSSPAPASTPPELTPAATVVRDFYEGINRRDLGSVSALISEACVYEDLIFSTPFVGREAILEFFKKFTESISSDLRFVIDDMSSEDSSAIGVTWHLEWRGRPFPFSKGCSFYRLEVVEGKRQIVYGRDCVEPATKPGDIALILIRGVTSMLQQFPQFADRF